MPLTTAERDELWTAYDRWIDQEGEDADGSLGRTALRGLRQLLADSAALANLRELAKQLPPPKRLLMLADWIDTTTPNDPNPEVQRDLRNWAGAISQLRAALEGSDG